MEKQYERKNRGRSFAIILILFAVVGVLSGYLCYREKQFNNIAQNQYNKEFYELVNYTENVKTMLAKTLVTKSAEYSAQNLVNVWREANLAQASISAMPVQVNLLEDANDFLNQVSDYSYSLSKMCIEGKNLNEKDINNLTMLKEQAQKLQEQLGTLSGELESGNFTWDKLTRTGKQMFNQNYDEIKVEFIDNVNNDLQNYAGLIYDGAFSEHVTQVKPKLLESEKEITEAEAKKVVEKYIKKIVEITSNGFQEGTIGVYNFTVKVENEKYFNISISKKGGYVVYLVCDREYEAQQLDVEQAKQKGKEYLSNVGFVNMQETYYTLEGNSVIINYASTQNGIILYPDLVKLKVALDNGEIIGLEANGYIYNHHDRGVSKIAITKEEARNRINEKLNISDEKIVVIPTDWKTEILCYEFTGTINEETFLIYINCENGKEEKIFMLIEDENGILTI